tara:strand:- start:152 stop:1291 length:1140 start_codon:yes stop_codon:yes gene_type:complete
LIERGFLDTNRLLFFYCTYGWIMANFLAAQIPSLSLVFVALRDAWVFIFILVLLRSRRQSDLILSFSILFLSLLGAIAFVDGDNTLTDILIYFYGFRDLCLISLVFYLLSSDNLFIPPRYIYGFVYLIFSLYLLQISSQIFGFEDQYSKLYNLDEYYAAKGVSITLAGGLFGERPGLPFYSPGLVAELCAGFIIIRKTFSGKWILWLFSLITLSKVTLYYLILRLFRKVYLLMAIAGLFSVPLLIGVLELAKDNYPNSIISMNSNSVIEHISPFQYITSEDFSYLPDKLGSSSIVAALLKGEDVSKAPESMLIGRLLDYNYLSVLLLFTLIWMFFHLHDERRFIFLVFIGLQVLTGMANHPVGFIPIIYFLYTNPHNKL